MSDWKKQLETLKQKTAVVSHNLPNVTADSIEIKKQQLQDRELLLKKQQAKLRRKLKIEDSKEPYQQSVSLIQNLQSDLRKNDSALRLIKLELDGLSTTKNEQLVKPVLEVSAADKIKWLNQNRVVTCPGFFDPR